MRKDSSYGPDTSLGYVFSKCWENTDTVSDKLFSKIDAID